MKESTSFIRSLVLNEYEKKKSRNIKFSLRAYAKFLNISITALSQMLNEKRSLSKKNLEKVISKLSLDENVQKTIADEVTNKRIKKYEEYFNVDEDVFATISEWYYYAILNLACTSKNDATPELISERLGIDIYITESALNRLLRLELISIKNGKLKRTTKPLHAGRDIPSKIIREYHKNNLKRAEDAIENLPIDLRQFHSVVLPVDMNKYILAKPKIDKFLSQMTTALSSDENTEVYTLAVQLFPNSRISKE